MFYHCMQRKDLPMHLSYSILKCPYFAFSDFIFNVLRNVAVCEYKSSARFQRSNCRINAVIVFQKNKPNINCLKRVISNSGLPTQT